MAKLRLAQQLVPFRLIVERNVEQAAPPVRMGRGASLGQDTQQGSDARSGSTTVLERIEQASLEGTIRRMPRMSALKLVLWGFLAVLGAVALTFVVGLVNPQEKVNGLWLVVAAACIYVLAFRFYGRWLSRRVVELNDQRVTPVKRLRWGR